MNATLYQLNLRKFVAPEIVYGAGARNFVDRYAKNLGAKKVLVVSDPGVMNAGWAGEAAENLDKAGLAYTIYTGVTPNPREEEVMSGAEAYKSGNCNLIVAVGGGSAIDCAKGIGIVSSNSRHILSFEGIDKVCIPMPPLICIPTTGGTSADLSQFVIIKDQKENIKKAIISKSVVPDVSLVDPVTLTTTDPNLRACTGIDALVHAIEAFVSLASSPMTDIHAIEAVRLISRNLLPSMQEPDNIEYVKNVMLGSLEAGLAFSNASLGAVHAMAHSLGGFLDLPHGECNAMLLNHVMEFNFPEVTERFERIGEAMDLDMRAMSHAAKKAAVVGAVSRLRKNAGVGSTLQTRGVHRADVPELAANALRDPCIVTNPRKANKRDLEVIYEGAM